MRSRAATFVVGIDVDAESLHLKAGRPQELRVLFFEPGSIGGNHMPAPVRTADGRHALAVTQTVTAKQDERYVDMTIDIELKGYEGMWVDIVVERARAPRARIVVAGLAVLPATAGLAGGPTIPRVRSACGASGSQLYQTLADAIV